VRVALAGLGAFGDQHLEALTGLADAELVAVVDPHASGPSAPPTSTECPSRFRPGRGARTRRRRRGDPLHATPMHAEQAIAVLAAGKHVQVEIPLATTGPTRDGWRMRTATRA